jgi:hypothetical protein
MESIKTKPSNNIYRKNYDEINWKKRSFTAKEYTPAVKRMKAVGREVKLERCDNCNQDMLLPDGTCMQCGVGPRIGYDQVEN